MNSRTALVALQAELKALKANGPDLPFLGICHWLSFEAVGAFRPILKKWPEYSGDPAYPVPHPYMSPEDAFMEYSDLWDRDTEYGQARWDLVDFALEYLRVRCDTQGECPLCKGEQSNLCISA